jgi:membrane protein
MKNNRLINTVKKMLSLFSQYEMGVYSGNASLLILMAMIPLLMLVISVVNSLPGYSAADAGEFLSRFVPDVPQVQALISNVLDNLSRQSGGLIASISAVTTLWSASGGISAVQTGLEKLHWTQRSSLKGKPAALLFTVLYVLLIPSVLVFQILRESIQELISNALGYLGMDALAQQISSVMQFSGWIVLAAMVLTVILTYTYLPNGKRTLKSQLPGSVFTCVLWIVFTLAFSFFIPRFWKASSIYGSLASIFLMTMWLKFMIMILFYGAALNKAMEE